jgi:hypothetical protein
MLGGNVPTDALTAATRRQRVDAVVIWSQQPKTARLKPIRAMSHNGVTVIAAGPGWAADRLPGHVRYATSLSAALHSLRDSQGPHY